MTDPGSTGSETCKGQLASLRIWGANRVVKGFVRESLLLQEGEILPGLYHHSGVPKLCSLALCLQLSPS